MEFFNVECENTVAFLGVNLKHQKPGMVIDNMRLKRAERLMQQGKTEKANKIIDKVFGI